MAKKLKESLLDLLLKAFHSGHQGQQIHFGQHDSFTIFAAMHGPSHSFI
jgi:hypothetical protein